MPPFLWRLFRLPLTLWTARAPCIQRKYQSRDHMFIVTTSQQDEHRFYRDLGNWWVIFLASLILTPPCVKYIKGQVQYWECNMNSICSCCLGSAKQTVWLWPSHTILRSFRAVKVMFLYFRIVEDYVRHKAPSTVHDLSMFKRLNPFQWNIHNTKYTQFWTIRQRGLKKDACGVGEERDQGKGRKRT